MPIGRKPTEAELTKIQRFAPGATADNVLVYRHLMVGDQIVPDRFLRLDREKTLPPFAKDTKDGATWIFNHNWYDPTQFGTAFDAELVNEPERALVEKNGRLVPEEVEARHLYGMFYMPLGLGLHGAPYPNTDSVATAIEMGVLRDTSIGFRLNRMECSICHNDYRDYNKCSHIAGRVYEVEQDGRMVNRICIVDGQGGALFEQSSVFAGAYPVAGIVRQGAVATGEPSKWSPLQMDDLKRIPSDVEVFCTFSSAAGMHFYAPPGTVLTDAPAAKSTEGALSVTGNPSGSDPQTPPEALTAAVEIGGRTLTLSVKAEALATLPDAVELGTAPAPDTTEADGLRAEIASLQERLTAAETGAQETQTKVEASEQAITAAQDRLRTALGLAPDADPVAEVERLSTDFQDTVTYREHLITETLAMGVRAYGNSFGAEGWEKFLRTPGRSLSELQTQFEAFEAETRKRIPSGRLSVAPDVPGSAPEEKPRDMHTYRIRPQDRK